MPSVNIVKACEIERTARVMQLEGIFELPPTLRSESTWTVTLDLPERWNVGLIVGPSGSGKTTVARELFGGGMMDAFDWPENKSILDAFPKHLGIKEIVALLSSVGFSSPPSWLRPFRALSNGEQFRVTMARLLAEKPDLAVVDEFTSVVDRTVAQIGSAAIQKTVRQRDQQFVAVSCHYDIVDWLEPDWVYQPHTGELLVGRSVHQRPKINLEVFRVHHSAWRLFRAHHYLDTQLNTSALCFVAQWNDTPVAFLAALSFPHAKAPGWRYHRLVCLPDYQGVGIGSALADYVGSVLKATGKPVRRTLSHPAVIHAANKSPYWKCIQSPMINPAQGKTTSIASSMKTASNRFTASFEYVGPSLSLEESQNILGTVITR